MRAHSVNDPIAAHLDWLRLLGRAENTITIRRRHLTRLAAGLPVPILEASEADLLNWRKSLQVSSAAVGNYVCQVRQFYAWAIRQGYRPAGTNPCAELPVPRPPRRLPRPIIESDLYAILAAAPARIRLWLVLAAWCGLRACEIASLRCENIRLEGDPVLIVASDATKGRTERVIPLCEFAVAEIRAAGLPARGWAFTRQDGHPGRNTAHRVTCLANEFMHELGYDWTLHKLRARFATQAYRSRRNLRAVQELLGHSRPDTTARYVAVAATEGRSAVARLPVPGII